MTIGYGKSIIYYIYIYKTAFMAQLAKASDTQVVDRGLTLCLNSSPVRKIKIGLKIIFRSDLI